MEIKIQSLSDYLKKNFKISIDNGVFKLHYRITVFFLLSSFFIISSKQFFGEPIYCVAGNDKIKEILKPYCWLHGTFTLKKSPEGQLYHILVFRNYNGMNGRKSDLFLHQFLHRKSQCNIVVLAVVQSG